MNTKNCPQQQSQPEAWYRVGMAWLAFGLPALVVVAALVTVVIAHNNAPIITRSIDGNTQTIETGSEDD